MNKELTVEDVLLIAERLASPDDWNVPSVYPEILRETVADIQAGRTTLDEVLAERESVVDIFTRAAKRMGAQ